MPTRGKCQSCGEVSFLTARLLRKKRNGWLYCLMICDKCRKFYEKEVEQA